MADRANIMSRYLEAPGELRAVLMGLSDAQLDVARSPGTWTIRQIAHHIVDGDDLWKMVIKAALGNGAATIGLPWYWEIPQDKWAASWNYAGRALGPSLALFQASRNHVAQLMETIPGAWDCSIEIRWLRRAPERLTVTDIIAAQARHAAGHLEEIQSIRQASG